MQKWNGVVAEVSHNVATRVLAGCHPILETHAGFSLFPGTLNVRLPNKVALAPDVVLKRPICVHYEDIKLQQCFAGGVPAVIMRTSTQEAGGSHPLDIVEIMAGSKLRDTLALDDGDSIVIEANLMMMD